MENFSTASMMTLKSLSPGLALNLALALIGVVLYETSQIPPAVFTTATLLFVAVTFLRGGFAGRVYSFVAVVLCILPLLHLVGFIVADDYAVYPNMGLALADQMNPEILDRLALMGLVTVCGLTAGAIAGLSRHYSPVASQRPNVSLSKVALLAFVSLGVIHLDAPSETIFKAAYTDSVSISFVQNLGSLFPLSFGLNLMAWHCVFQMRKSAEKVYALVLLASVTAISVIFYQLLRGDREFLGLLIGLLFLFDKYTRLSKHVLAPAIAVLALYFVMQFVGYYRAVAVAETGIIEGLSDFLLAGDWFNGTWTAALLTPLSAIGDVYSGQRALLLGQTYIDLFLSIPPTSIAEYLGYHRPITGERGPAWDVSYGLGGTYISVVPFLNFSMIGVVMQTFVIGFLLGVIDRRSYANSSMWTLLGFAVGVVLWGVIWYGEMYLLRALVTTFPLLVFTWYVLNLNYKGRLGHLRARLGEAVVSLRSNQIRSNKNF